MGTFFARLIHGAPKPPPPPLRFVVGAPYEAGGIWRYPRESFSYDHTGIAGVIAARHGPLTTDDEAFDPAVLAAASPTLQLPAIVAVTNLANGRQVSLRVNDRGPADPARLIAVTKRAAALLDFPADGVAPVRVTVLAGPSHALAQALNGAGETVAIATAPIGAVQATPLGAPGAAQVAARADAGEVAADVPALRLPETVAQVPVTAWSLAIDAGHFGRAEFASRRQRQLAGLGAHIERTVVDGAPALQVVIGPLGSIAEADATLARAIAAGVSDARIVVVTGATESD